MDAIPKLSDVFIDVEPLDGREKEKEKEKEIDARQQSKPTFQTPFARMVSSKYEAGKMEPTPKSAMKSARNLLRNYPPYAGDLSTPWEDWIWEFLSKIQYYELTSKEKFILLIENCSEAVRQKLEVMMDMKDLNMSRVDPFSQAIDLLTSDRMSANGKKYLHLLEAQIYQYKMQVNQSAQEYVDKMYLLFKRRRDFHTQQDISFEEFINKLELNATPEFQELIKDRLDMQLLKSFEDVRRAAVRFDEKQAAKPRVSPKPLIQPSALTTVTSKPKGCYLCGNMDHGYRSCPKTDYIRRLLESANTSQGGKKDSIPSFSRDVSSRK